MRPNQSDLRSASFTLELMNAGPSEEHVQTLALAYATHRRVVRDQVLAAIELWARDERAKASKLRQVSDSAEIYQHGIAQGMELVLIGLRKVVRELRVA